MIEIENEIYSNLSTLLKTSDSTINMGNMYINTPSLKPFVSIEEIDQYTDNNSEDSSHDEKFAFIVFETNIYTEGLMRKSKAKSILTIVDDYMRSLGFERLSMTPMQDNKAVIYRLVIRYRGLVSKDKIIYRR